MSAKPHFDAYEGSAPYVFISYAHKDAGLVYLELNRLHALGVNVWYDAGITPSEEWPKELEKKIRDSALVIFFISALFVKSENCRNEVNYVLRIKKPGLYIYLDNYNWEGDTHGLELQISCKQGIMKAKLDEDHYVKKLRRALSHLLPSTSTATSKSKKSLAVPVGPKAGRSWQNSLGLKFVSAGTPGVLFSIYDTRVQDYHVFARSFGYDRGEEWKTPGFPQDPDHPVVNVSWEDAKAFCQWLTETERDAGILGRNQYYRLPTDAEWSAAAGLEETAKGSPKSKDGQTGAFPWGKSYPPPAKAGNYLRQKDGSPHSCNSNIPGTDSYPYTSPVGSFKANRYGLFDMGGNVWQWCEDWYDEDQRERVFRGASWHRNERICLLSSFRGFDVSDSRHGTYGFRVVIVV